MAKYSNIYLIGEDLIDPYGGAFKVTKGLSTKFPDRVINTPISEAGIVGFANGMAMRGLLPIVEIMFGDFSTIIVDQIVNHATKFERMYAGKVRCPIIIRTPMGGYRGYGPTHSQCLEKIFLGIPGLVTVACDIIHDQHLIWDRMIKFGKPCLYIENKSLYSQKMKAVKGNIIENFEVKFSKSYFPTVSLKLSNSSDKADVIIFTYGGMVQFAMNVSKQLFVDEEIVAEIVIPSIVSPLPEEDLLKHIESSNNVFVLEEGTKRNGWGAELIAFISENTEKQLSCHRYAAKNTIIPNSKGGENFVLPNELECCELIKEMINVI